MNVVSVRFLVCFAPELNVFTVSYSIEYFVDNDGFEILKICEGRILNWFVVGDKTVGIEKAETLLLSDGSLSSDEFVIVISYLKSKPLVILSVYEVAVLDNVLTTVLDSLPEDLYILIHFYPN